jgi:hypothetical protein
MIVDPVEFLEIPKLFSNFFHDKVINFNKKKQFDIDVFYDFRYKCFDVFKNVNKKEIARSVSIKSDTPVDKELDTTFNQVKMMILFIKFIIGDKVYANIDKNILFQSVKLYVNYYLSKIRI